MGGMPAFSASMQRLVLPPHPRPLPPELWLAPFDTASASLALLSPPVTLPSPLRLLHQGGPSSVTLQIRSETAAGDVCPDEV